MPPRSAFEPTFLWMQWGKMLFEISAVGEKPRLGPFFLICPLLTCLWERCLSFKIRSRPEVSKGLELPHLVQLFQNVKLEI